MSSREPNPSAAAEAAVDEFLRRVDHGEEVDQAAFIVAHPECADELRTFFAGAELFQRLAKSSVPAPAGDTVIEVSRGNEPIQTKSTEPWSKLPTTFGRYRIEKLLGRGAMGAVYQAQDSQLHRPVALKIPTLSGNKDAEARRRLLREAQAAAILAHPNLCRVFDVGELDGVSFIAMELIEGRPLSRYIRSGQPMSVRMAARLVQKLASALQSAHRQGVVHRDLKPANVLINRDGEPIVMDFGLSFRPVLAGQERLTQEGTLVGSPAYMSPEQARADSKAIGPASDIYGLGVIFYELLTGQIPFTGSLLSILAKVLSEPPTPVQTLRPEVDDEIAAVCHRMLAKLPQERFASMEEVAAVLAKWLKRTGSPAAKPAGKVNAAAASKPRPISKQTFDGLIATAKQCLKQHDYEQAAQLLEEIPYSLHTDESAALLHKAQDARDEVMWLLADLDQAVGLHQLEELPVTLKRLLQLKPGHKRAKELLARIESYGKGDDVRFRYSREGELLPAYNDDGLFNGVGRMFVLTISLAIAVFIGVSWWTWNYLLNPQLSISVEIDDPTATVVFGDHPVELIDGKGVVQATPGKYGYSALKNGRPVKTDEFAVVRGQTNSLVIQLNPAALAANAKPLAVNPKQNGDTIAPVIAPAKVGAAEAANSNADREAAAWALSLDGQVEISVADQLQWLRGSVAKLPSVPFNIKRLIIDFGTNVTDADLARLKPLRAIEQFAISNAPLVTVNGVRHLSELTTLSSVGFYATKINDEAVALLSRLPNLVVLQISETPVTDTGLSHLKASSKLARLAIGPQITNAGLKTVSGFSNLLGLTLRGSGITDQGFAHLTGHQSLTTLTLGNTVNVTSKGLSVLRTLTALTSLTMSGALLNSDAIDHLAAVPKLSVLSITNKTSGSDLSLLVRLVQLESLDFTNTDLSDAELVSLPQFSSLKTMKINQAAITDTSVERLARQTSLVNLELHETAMTAAGIARLQRLAPKLNIVAEIRASAP